MSKKSTVQPGQGSTTSRPAASASPTSPASPFEDDPAVKALRAWAIQVGRTVNAGKFTDSALEGLMTPQFALQMKDILGSEVGHQYPGPLPFTPIAVVKQDAEAHSFNLCVTVGGFSLDPVTHQPADAHQVGAMIGEARSVNGKWVVSNFYPGSFSCAGVRVPEPTT